jgi:transposase
MFYKNIMYSIDLRKVTINVYNLLKSLRKTGKICNISHTTVSRWLFNTDRKSYKTNYENTKTYKVKEIIKTTILSNPFISLIKLKEIIKSVLKIEVSKELLRNAIKIHGYTKKKAKFFGNPSNLKEKTEKFIEFRDKYIKEGKIFVSIDETSFGRNGIIQKGYSLKGMPLKICKKNPRITTTSYLVACNSQKIINKLGIAGSFNTEKFYSFINNLNIPKGSVILLDNVAFHHSKVIKELANIKNFILLYTPPYSPWYNPIEGIFSVVKRNYYRDISIEESFSKVTELHCTNFFKYSLSYKV